MEELIKQMFEAGQSGAWAMAIGFGIMLLIQVVDKMKLLNWVPADSSKWLAAGLAVLGSLSTGLLSGAAPLDMAVAAMSVAFSAVGSWEFFGKLIASKMGGSEQ